MTDYDSTFGPDDPHYPPALLGLAHPPDPLFVRGRLPGERPLVAIVGTRAASPAGLLFAERLAGDLARLGIGILSGGARGIDAAAHEGALRADGYTAVVVATGVDVVYPPEHAALFARVVASQGCVMSEREHGSTPTATAFPSRNRIVAALAACTVVVEAPARSGALSTARAARALGRPVLAMPGRPDDPNVAGCVELLRRGAHVCAAARDVLDVLARPMPTVVTQPTLPIARAARTRPPRDARGRVGVDASANEHEQQTRTSAREEPMVGSEDERVVLALLGARAIELDVICERSGLGVARARAALAMLGLAGLAAERAGDAFVRVGAGGERRTR